MENPIYCGSPKFKNWRYIEIIIENQEVDNVTKLQLVQPLSFGDTVLCYHRKIKQLILGRYCSYHQACQFNNPYRDVEYRVVIEVRDL